MFEEFYVLPGKYNCTGSLNFSFLHFERTAHTSKELRENSARLYSVFTPGQGTGPAFIEVARRQMKPFRRQGPLPASMERQWRKPAGPRLHTCGLAFPECILFFAGRYLGRHLCKRVSFGVFVQSTRHCHILRASRQISRYSYTGDRP